MTDFLKEVSDVINKDAEKKRTDTTALRLSAGYRNYG